MNQNELNTFGEPRKIKGINDNYEAGGLILVTILGIFGAGIDYSLWEASNRNFKELLYSNGFPAIIGLFFLAVCIYCWILFFDNVIIKPRKDVVYLKNTDGRTLTFINKKGKKFICIRPKQEYTLGAYYNVLRTMDNIKEIIGYSAETFTNKKAKDSYWLNFYTVVGNFENIFLLPIAYLILVPGILSFILSEGFNKIYGIIFSLLPLFIIGYDLVYKIKKNSKIEKIENTTLTEEEKNKMINSVKEDEELLILQNKSLIAMDLFQEIIPICILSFVTMFMLYLSFISADKITLYATQFLSVILIIGLLSKIIKFIKNIKAIKEMKQDK